MSRRWQTCSTREKLPPSALALSSSPSNPPHNRVVVVARGRFDDLRDFGVDGAVRHLLQSLLDDAARLPHLFEADEVAVVRVAVLADGHVEVEVCVGGVRAAFAYVPCDAG